MTSRDAFLRLRLALMPQSSPAITKSASTAMIAKWIVVSVVMPSGSRLSPEADVAEVSFICL